MENISLHVHQAVGTRDTQNKLLLYIIFPYTWPSFIKGSCIRHICEASLADDVSRVTSVQATRQSTNSKQGPPPQPTTFFNRKLQSTDSTD